MDKLKFFKGCLPQILLGSFLNNLTQMILNNKMVRVSIMTAFKVGLSHSKNNCFICFSESPLKMTENAVYFILKALFVLKIFKFLS